MPECGCHSDGYRSPDLSSPHARPLLCHSPPSPFVQGPEYFCVIRGALLRGVLGACGNPSFVRRVGSRLRGNDGEKSPWLIIPVSVGVTERSETGWFLSPRVCNRPLCCHRMHESSTLSFPRMRESSLFVSCDVGPQVMPIGIALFNQVDLPLAVPLLDLLLAAIAAIMSAWSS